MSIADNSPTELLRLCHAKEVNLMATLWVSRTVEISHDPIAVALDAARQAFVLHLAQTLGMEPGDIDADHGLVHMAVKGSVEQVAELIKEAYNWGVANFIVDVGRDELEASREHLAPFLSYPLVEIAEG